MRRPWPALGRRATEKKGKRSNVINTGAHLSQLGFRFYISHRLPWLFQKHDLTTPRKREKFACTVKPETEKTHNHQSIMHPSSCSYFRISTSNWQSCLCKSDKLQIRASCNVSVFQPDIPAFKHSVRETQLPWLYHPKMCSSLVFSNYVILPFLVMAWSSTNISAHCFFFK